MKLIICFVLFLHLQFGHGKEKINCNAQLDNKTISLEYNYYPGYQATPGGSRLNKGYRMMIKRFGSEVQKWSITNLESRHLWKVEKCRTHLCFSSLRSRWKKYYLYMPQSGLKFIHKWRENLYHYDNIAEATPKWIVEFDVLCDDCSKMRHCNVVNRYGDSSETKDYGKMYSKVGGYVTFGYNYDSSYDTWFDWTVHVQGEEKGSNGQTSLVVSTWLFTLLMVLISSYK